MGPKNLLTGVEVTDKEYQEFLDHLAGQMEQYPIVVKELDMNSDPELFSAASNITQSNKLQSNLVKLVMELETALVSLKDKGWSVILDKMGMSPSDDAISTVMLNLFSGKIIHVRYADDKVARIREEIKIKAAKYKISPDAAKIAEDLLDAAITKFNENSNKQS